MSDGLDVFLEEKEAKVCDMVDGQHIYFECSNCAAPLMDLWQFNPTKDVIYKVRAECPFCGDHSWVKDVYSYSFGPTGMLGKDGQPYCSIGDWYDKTINGEVITIFETVKARDYNGQ